MSVVSRVPLVVICSAVAVSFACSRDVERAKGEFMARGDRYMSDKNAEAAIIEYRNAIQRDPRFGEAYRKLAAAEIESGDVAEALRSAKTAADLLPDVPEAQLEAGNLMLLAERYPEARAYAQRALARNGNDIRARVLLGNALAGLKDADRAILEFEAALRLDPHQSGIYAGLAAAKAGLGDREAAERAFRQAVAMDPRSPQPRLALAQFYWSTQRTEEAERVLLEAHDVLPRDTGVNLTLGVFYQTIRRPEAAELYLRTAAQVGGEPRLTLSLADYYMARDRTEDAEALLTPLASDRNFGPLATMRLAAIAQMEGHHDEALAIIDRALAADPKDAHTLAAKSDLLRAQNRIDEAAKAADAALAANPASAEVQFVRGRVYEAERKYEAAARAFMEVLRLNPHANAARVELARLELSSNPKDAATIAAEAAQAEPTNVNARLTLARALLRQGDAAKAQTVLGDLLRADPSNAAALAQRGTLLASTNDAVAARASFDRALTLDPANDEAIAGATALDFEAGQRQVAFARLNAAMARAPRDTRLRLVAASAYATASDWSRAESLLSSVLELDASDVNAYALLGRIYLSQNRLQAARTQYEKLAAREERPVGPLTAIGVTYMLGNDYAHAQTAFERVLQIDPKAPVAANNLAWIYLENGGSVEMAVHLAETASAALPDEAEVSDTLGWAYFKHGQLADALSALEKSEASDPANAETLYHLALVQQKRGDRNAARKAFEHYLSLDHSSARSADVRRRLESLGT